jgi:hypothetical protein
MMIDPYCNGWLARLDSACESQPSVSTLYLLVDGAFIAGLHRKVGAALSSCRASTLLFGKLPGCNEETGDVSPFLLVYQPSNARLRAVLEECSGWPMISAIETTENQAELTERLAAWCIVEAGGQRFNFRFPDTRRLPAIFEAFTAKQRAEFSGPATRWSFIDRGGNWAELAVAAAPSAVAERPELDDQQFAMLVSDSEVDEVVMLMRDRCNHVSGRHSQQYARVSLALRIARRARLDTVSTVSWCEFLLMQGLTPDEHQGAACFSQWAALDSSEKDSH